MAIQDLEQGQLVICTVDKVIGTTVFVKIDDYDVEGTITFSEIAPGRIRNIREYVVPGKKIVCQTLSVREDRIQLSFRRVKPQDRKVLLDKIDKEKSYKAILKTVLKEKAGSVIEKINEEDAVVDFFEKLKNDPKLIDKYVGKEEAEKINKILETKKEKLKEVKKIFRLSTKEESGAPIVKKIIQDACKGTTCEVSYVAAGKYAMTLKGEQFKGLKSDMVKAMDQIEKTAKKQDCDFSIEKS